MPVVATPMQQPQCDHSSRWLQNLQKHIAFPELADHASTATAQAIRLSPTRLHCCCDVQVIATAAPQLVPETGPQWVLAAACLTLKGGRTDWLIEKATELGAHSVLPLITERSQTGTTRSKFKSMSAKASSSSSSSSEEFHPSRLERLAVAASKQSLRAHALQLQPAVALQDLVPLLQQSPVSLVAVAGAPSALQVLQQLRQHHQPEDQQAETGQGHMLQVSGPQHQQQPQSSASQFW